MAGRSSLASVLDLWIGPGVGPALRRWRSDNRNPMLVDRMRSVAVIKVHECIKKLAIGSQSGVKLFGKHARMDIQPGPIRKHGNSQQRIGRFHPVENEEILLLGIQADVG